MSQERVGIIVEVQGGNEALSLMKQLDNQIKKLNGQKIKFDFGGKEVQALVSATQQTQNLGNEMAQTSAKAKTMRQMMRSTFNNISSRVMHTGQQMQVLGKTLTQISSPMRSLMRSTVFAGGFAVLDKVSSGLSSAFSRYDTMKMYPRIMKQIGFSDTQARKSIEDLNKAVDGLPTGLDEIVDMAQKFTLSLGDIEEGTKTAIAANNAFLASGTDEATRYQGMLQLRDLLNGKDLNAREWMSLTSAMGPAIREMGKQFGYTDDNMQEFIQSVNAGEVSTKDFLEALKDVGLEGGKVYDMARETMNTWQAFTSRIGTAFSRMGFGILESLDEVIKVMTGDKEASLNKWLDSQVIPGIDSLTASIKEWINANPDLIIDFLNTIRSFDFGGLFRGMGKGFLTTAQQYLEFFKVFAGKDAEGFGRFMARAGFYGKVLNIMGGFFKGSRGIIATLGTILALPAMKIKSSRSGQSSIFGRMLSHVGSVSQAKKLQKVMKGMPTVTQTMRGVFASLSGMMKLFGMVSLGVGTGFVAFRGIKTMFQDLKEIVDIINSFDREQGDWKTATSVIMGMTGFFLAFAGLGKILGGAGLAASKVIIVGELIIGAITGLASLILAGNMKLLASAAKDFKSIIDNLNAGIEGINRLKSVKANKKKIDDAVDAFNSVYVAMTGGGKQGTGIVTTKGSAKKYNTITENLLGIIKNINKTIDELNSLPDIKDLDGATTKVTDVIEKLKEIGAKLNVKFDTGLLDFLGGGVTTGSTRRGASIVENVTTVIKNIKDAVTELKELEAMDTELDEATSIATKVGKQMGEIFTALNTAFGETQTVDQDIEGVGKIKGSYNMGVTPGQRIQAYNLKKIFESFKETLTSVREAYQTIMGGEGDIQIDPDAFKEKMNALIGEEGIVPKLKELFDKLGTDFGGSDVDIETPMESFKNAIGSIKGAVLTLQEIEGIEFKGDTGMAGVIASISQVVTDLTNAFNAEVIAELQAQVEAFKLQVEALLLSIQSLGGEEGEGVSVNIILNPTIEGDEETVKMLQDAHDAIETEINAIKDLSQSIPLSFTISASFSGLYETIADINSAASQLRIARNNLASAGGGGVSIGAWTGGYIGSHGLQYRAGGGSIFKKRGSDVVPAMLSYGEYVQSKRAVDFFGIDFMRKVNNLDYRGALNSLLGRANAMAKGSTVINNYDNRSVTINGADVSNAGFTFKRASRFVGAI